MYAIVNKSQENWNQSKMSGNVNKLNTFCVFKTDNEFGFPEVESNDLDPIDLIGFHQATKKNLIDKAKTVHFFLDDYKFESLWSDPRKYVELLSFYNGMISPTFSIWSNQPYALNLYNMYRSRWCTRFFQECGIDVLVDLRWADKDSYDFAFSGINKGSSIIINTVGTYNLDNRKIFLEGFETALERIQPKKLFIYGEHMPVKFEDYVSDVKYYDSFWKKQRAKIKRVELNG